jgi:hypothetical protein
VTGEPESALPRHRHQEVARAVQNVYNRSVTTALHIRSRAGILRFSDGSDLLGPEALDE